MICKFINKKYTRKIFVEVLGMDGKDGGVCLFKYILLWLIALLNL